MLVWCPTSCKLPTILASLGFTICLCKISMMLARHFSRRFRAHNLFVNERSVSYYVRRLLLSPLQIMLSISKLSHLASLEDIDLQHDAQLLGERNFNDPKLC